MISKSIKIIILLILIVVGFIFFKNNDKVEEIIDMDNVDIDISTVTDYKDKVCEIISDYYDVLKDNLNNIDINGAFEDKLLNLKVPTDYRDLHFDLFLAIKNMEDYLVNDNLESKIDSEKLISEVESAYDCFD